MAVVVSAPGKVLITGGYLVLEPPNAGIVFSTSARFFAIVKPLHANLERDSWAWSWSDVKVLSPQLSKQTMYKLSLRDLTLQKVSPHSDGNAFVEQAIQLALSSAKVILKDDEDRCDQLQKLLLKGFEVTVLGSNDFYSFRKLIESKGLSLCSDTLVSLPAFSSIILNSPDGTDKSDMLVPEVAKTGIGSSAAMTTAVCACILHYLGAVKVPQARVSQKWQVNVDLDIVHVVSQVAHLMAQGKVGSGFDISAAVYGSQRYVRFSPSIVSMVMNTHLPLLEVMKVLLSQKWDGEKKQFSLPPLFSLVIGEPGAGGSHTPSMVGAVQRWRKDNPEKASVLWSQLAQANLDVEKGMLQLKQIAESDAIKYRWIIESCQKYSPEQWTEKADIDIGEKIVTALLETRHAFLLVRSLLRELGDAAGVPIEPPSQSALLDSTMNIEGVLLAGVPGAGGYDAVFAVTLSYDARSRVVNFWTSQSVLALCVVDDFRGVQLEEGDPRQDTSI
eukprot:c26763_g1_i1 orf=217-1722(+)